MSEDPFELPPDFTGKVPLFPLPNLVMFPSNVQPLHIFESRYREMFEDVIATDRLIAMATLQPGYESEYYSRPPIAPTVCIGRVADYERQESGAYDLLLIAVARARIEQEITPVRSYRRANVTLLEQECEDDDSDALRRLGHELTSQLVEQFPAMEQLASEFDAGKVTFAALTDIVAFHFPLDIPFKLTLLAESDAARRAALLIPKLHEQMEESPQPPPDFSSN